MPTSRFKLSAVAALFLCAAPWSYAQSFEVASIKPSAILANGRYGNYRMSGGPGTNDPGRLILENFDLFALIVGAYDMPYYRVSAPEWTHEVRFDIAANVPEGTTKEQFLLMQQNLLATRLGLVVHREKKEMPIYELVVAKGGSKLKEASSKDETSEPFPNSLKQDAEGFPVLPPGHTTYAIMGGNRARLQGAAETMEHFASTLADQMRAPVRDATGLTGKYDFTLKWLAVDLRAGDDPGLNLESALPSQLGLTLKHTRGPVDILVVDHVEKIPTEN